MIFNKAYFERVFDKGDYWSYAASEYERIKYTRQLDAIKQYFPRLDSILEVGCAQGVFTSALAQRYPGARILGVDISHRAIECAQKTCTGLGNVQLIEADFLDMLKRNKLPPKNFDVIIQSESLYYLFPHLLVHMNLECYLQSLLAGLKPGGIFVTANGLNLVSKTVLGVYCRILKRYCNTVHTVQYREWNEFRQRTITYDIRIFRLKTEDSLMRSS